MEPPLDPPEGVWCEGCNEWSEDCTCPEPDPDTLPGGYDYEKERRMMSDV